METLYDISLKQEIMLEAYAGLLAEFHDYFRAHHVDPYTETSRPDVILFQEARKIHNEILDHSTMEEMNKVEEKFHQFKMDLEKMNG